MTVKVTKPALNLREELSSLKKPSGVAGEAMLRADTPQEQFDLIGAGRKNLIINGDFQVAQRGTSFTGAAAQYMLDRWYGRTVGAAFSQQSNQYNRKSFSLFTKTSDDVDPFYNQVIEDGAAIAQGKYITVSYEYKLISGSTKWFQSGAQVYVYTVDDATYRGGNFTSTESLDNGWVKGSYTVAIPENSTGHVRAGIEFNPTNGVNYSVAITNFQLELGSVATPFEHRSYGEELALCERYYQVHRGFHLGMYGSMSNMMWKPRVPMAKKGTDITIGEYTQDPNFSRSCYSSSGNGVASSGTYGWNSSANRSTADKGWIFHGNSATATTSNVSYAPDLVLYFDAEL